ncbi:MAG: GNAT family N-acetyltransferase, partial [Candidatus Dormiibacterota bacterium]
LRLRPVARATLLLEGLLVDTQRRRTGIATELVGRALAQAREQGADQVRMVGADDAFAGLATKVGFRSAVDARRWRASRLEGEEPARLGGREEAEGLLRMVAGTPGFTAYARRLAGPDEGRDLDATTLRERAERGLVRVGPGGRALAVLLDGEDRVQVGFLGGHEAPLRTLAEQLRFEADLHDVSEVSLWLPETHPAAPVLEGAGYRRDVAPRLALYDLDLTNGPAQ